MFSLILMSFMVFSKRSICAVEDVEINSSPISFNTKKQKNMITAKEAYQKQKKKRENLFERNKELTEIQIQLLCDNSRLKQRIQDLKRGVEEMTHNCSHINPQDILSHSAELVRKVSKHQQAPTEKPTKHLRILETETNDNNIKHSSDHLKNEMILTHGKDTRSLGVFVDESEKTSELQKDAQGMRTWQPRDAALKQQYVADTDLHKREVFMKNIDSNYVFLQIIEERTFENILSKNKLQMKKLKEDQKNQQQNVQKVYHYFPTDLSLHTEHREEECFDENITTNGGQCQPHSEMLNESCELIVLREDNVTSDDVSSQDSYLSLDDKNSANLSTQDDLNLKNDCLLNVAVDELTLTLGATEEVVSGISDEDKIQEKKSKPLKFKTGLVKRYQEREMSICRSREKIEEVFVPQCVKS